MLFGKVIRRKKNKAKHFTKEVIVGHTDLDEKSWQYLVALSKVNIA